ncbi:MAG: hypothetical protein ABL984_12475 [Pyrinomonadaceae bacterium]
MRLLRYSTLSGNFYVAANQSHFVTQFEDENLGVHQTSEAALQSLSQSETPRWLLIGIRRF